MARIRIIDEWLRSPVSPPSRYRAIMVVAERWAEQRVLMHAFQKCNDQTRPTIVLHGAEVAIGPAGTDPSGPWGLHVQPPVDGRAQELRQQLELAAKRLVGAKHSPARLEDEQGSFDNKKTNYWSPGAPRDRGSQRVTPAPGSGYYEPALVAPPSDSSEIPSAARRQAGAMTAVPMSATPVPGAPPAAVDRRTPQPVDRRTPQPAANPGRRRRRGWTSPVPTAPAREVGARTALGFAGAPVTARGGGHRAGSEPGGKKLAKMVGRTMPVGFQLSRDERDVLNALGEAPLTARQVAQIAGVPDGVAWMERLMSKLADHGLDLVVPGDDAGGEPTYVLRR
jgi:hypothetical protein